MKYIPSFKLFEDSIQPHNPLDVAEDQEMEIEDEDPARTHTIYERVVWKKEHVIKTHELNVVSYKDAPGVYGIHVGDADFWFSKLVDDYGRESSAWVMEIKTVPGDVLVADIDNNIPDQWGNKGDSSVLLTTRTELKEGVDFTYTRELSEDDYEGEDDYSEDGPF